MKARAEERRLKKLEEEKSNARIAQENHNKEVKSTNKDFTANVIKTAHGQGGFEESSHTGSLSGCKSDPADDLAPERGNSMVLNVDLGARGHQVLKGLDTEDPKDIAARFAKQHKLGPRTEDKLHQMVKDKKNQFLEFNKIEYKSDH